MTSKQWLQHIINATELIEKFVADGRELFDQNELVQVWIIHHIQIIGEAARNVSDSVRDFYPEIPWRLIIGMRDVLVHQYFNIDLEEIWDTAENDLPELKRNIETILKKIKHDE